MIHGFHPDHFIGDALIVGMDMLDQLELGLTWADDQDFRGAGEGFHDLVIIVLVFGLATAADRAPLAMEIAIGCTLELVNTAAALKRA